MSEKKPDAENSEVAAQQEPQKREALPTHYQRRREAEGMHEFSGGRVWGGGTWAGRDR